MPQAILVLGILALLLKLLIAATTIGTNDVDAFFNFLRKYHGWGAVFLYEGDPTFNHPPFLIRILQGVRLAANGTGVPFPFWMRVPAILADFGSLLLVTWLLRERMGERSVRLALGLMAIAPTSVMVSGFHGNTDSLVFFFVLLSLILLDSPGLTALAGAAMGMAINVKIVPVVLWPALCLWLPDLRRRLVYFGGAVAVFAAASMPALFQLPRAVARKVFGYESTYGHWGLSRITRSLPPAFETLDRAFGQFGRPFLGLALLGFGVWMNCGARKPSPYTQCGVIVVAFLSLTPGFGVQYLAWLVPFAVGLGFGASLLHQIAAGVFLFAVYTFWSGGFPWFYADANRAGFWGSGIVPMELACWASIVVLFALSLRVAAKEREDPS
jgi:hypothetical protein